MRAAREAAGVTQEELAARAGLCGQNAVSHLERSAAHLPPAGVWNVYVSLGLDPVRALIDEGLLPEAVGDAVSSALR